VRVGDRNRLLGWPAVVEHAGDRLIEGLSLRDEDFPEPFDGLAAAPPLPHLRRIEGASERSGAVAPQGLVEREVVEVAARSTAVVVNKSTQQIAVPVSVEDAFEYDIEALASAYRLVRSTSPGAWASRSSPVPSTSRRMRS
jgi:hypothetical protein